MTLLTIPFLVTPEDGDPYEVVADTRDIYVWEKTTPNKGVTLQQAMEEIRFLELYRLAWIAARRQGMFSGTIDQFSASCQVITTEQDDDENEEEGVHGGPVPTRPGASPGPSSNSPSSPASRPRSGRKKATGP